MAGEVSLEGVEKRKFNAGVLWQYRGGVEAKKV